MSIEIVRIPNFGHPDPVDIPDDTEFSFKLHMLKDRNESPSELLYQDIQVLETSDRKAVRSGLIKFAKIAQNGQNLNINYNSKQCHEAFDFTYEHKNHNVWRIRQNDVRIYFIYLPFKNICILRIDTKRTDKLSEGEELVIKNRAILAIDNSGTIYCERLK